MYIKYLIRTKSSSEKLLSFYFHNSIETSSLERFIVIRLTHFTAYR